MWEYDRYVFKNLKQFLSEYNEVSLNSKYGIWYQV
jgi:hypothetical protein